MTGEHERLMRLTGDLELLAAHVTAVGDAAISARDAIDRLGLAIAHADEQVGLMRLRLQGDAT